MRDSSVGNENLATNEIKLEKMFSGEETKKEVVRPMKLGETPKFNGGFKVSDME